MVTQDGEECSTGTGTDSNELPVEYNRSSTSNVLLYTRGYTIKLHSDVLGSDDGQGQGDGIQTAKSSDNLELPEGYTAVVPLSRTESRFPSLDEVVQDSALSEWLGSVGSHHDVQLALMEEGENRCNGILLLADRAVDDRDWGASLAGDAPTLSTVVHWFRGQLHSRSLQTYTTALHTPAAQRDDTLVSDSIRDTNGNHHTKDGHGLCALGAVEALASCSAMLKLFIALCPLTAACPVQLASCGLIDALFNGAPKLNLEIDAAMSDRYTTLPSAGTNDWRQTQIRLFRRRALILISNIAVGHDHPQVLWHSTAITESLSNLSTLTTLDEGDLLFAVLHNLTAKLPDTDVEHWFKLPSSAHTLMAFYGAVISKTTDEPNSQSAAVRCVEDLVFVPSSSSSSSWLTIFGLQFYSRLSGQFAHELVRRCISTQTMSTAAAIFTHLEQLIQSREDSAQTDMIKFNSAAQEDTKLVSGDQTDPSAFKANEEKGTATCNRLSGSITQYAATQPSFHRMYNYVLQLIYEWLQAQFALQFDGTDNSDSKTNSSTGKHTIILFPPFATDAALSWTTSDITECAAQMRTADSEPAVLVTDGEDTSDGNGVVKVEPCIVRSFLKLLASLTADLQTSKNKICATGIQMLGVLYDAIGDPLIKVCVAGLKLVTAVEMQIASFAKDQSAKSDVQSCTAATERYDKLLTLRRGLSTKTLLLCIANLCNDRPKAQSAVENIDGLSAVLNRTRISVVEPLQRESAILAVRAICKGHKANLNRLQDLLANKDSVGARELNKPQDFGLAS